MPETAAESGGVVDMVTYLRDTIGEIDSMILEMQAKRTALAMRLAVIEAATDESLVEAADDYAERVSAGRSYADAVPAESLIQEAHARFGQ